MSGTKDMMAKQLNDLASRVEMLEFLLQSNDITMPSMAGTNNNGELYPPQQQPDTTFNFPGYNSQSQQGQQIQNFQNLQALSDLLGANIAQQQLLSTGGSADFNQAGALDAFQGTADDGANGNGTATSNANTPKTTTLYGFCALLNQSFASGVSATITTLITSGATNPNSNAFDTTNGALSSGIFTVAIAGYYLIAVRVEMADTISNTAGTLSLIINGSTTMSVAIGPGNSGGFYRDIIFPMKLSKGDKLKSTFIGTFAPTPYTPTGFFSAILLSQN